MASFVRIFIAGSICLLASGFPSSNMQVRGRFSPRYRFGGRPRIRLMSSSSLAAHRGRPPVSTYFIGTHGSRKSLPPPVHDIQIIRQTVVVNKNAGPNHAKAPVSSGGNRRMNDAIALPLQADPGFHGQQSGLGQRSGGIVAIPDGFHILPSLQSFRQPSVRQALKGLSSKMAGINQNLQGQGSHQNKTNSQSSGNSSNNPTNIIIYRKGQERPIVIKTRGSVTLAKTKTPDGKTKIFISQNPSKTKSPTTTLKPGEDPPEVENEPKQHMVVR